MDWHTPSPLGTGHGSPSCSQGAKACVIYHTVYRSSTQSKESTFSTLGVHPYYTIPVGYPLYKIVYKE